MMKSLRIAMMFASLAIVPALGLAGANGPAVMLDGGCCKSCTCECCKGGKCGDGCCKDGKCSKDCCKDCKDCKDCKCCSGGTGGCCK